jgi:hypothetical protein
MAKSKWINNHLQNVTQKTRERATRTPLKTNRIGGVMVSVLASNAVDCGFEPSRITPETIKLVFLASPLSTRRQGERAKTG